MKILPDADNPLLSNRSFASHARDLERELAAHPVPPVDLRTISRAEWGRWVNFHLTLPPRLLDGFDPGPIPRDSVAPLEDAVARFHGVTEPYNVQMCPVLESTGRAWKHVPEAGASLTGFFLDGPETFPASLRKRDA